MFATWTVYCILYAKMAWVSWLAVVYVQSNLFGLTAGHFDLPTAVKSAGQRYRHWNSFVIKFFSLTHLCMIDYANNWSRSLIAYSQISHDWAHTGFLEDHLKCMYPRYFNECFKILAPHKQHPRWSKGYGLREREVRMYIRISLHRSIWKFDSEGKILSILEPWLASSSRSWTCAFFCRRKTHRPYHNDKTRLTEHSTNPLDELFDDRLLLQVLQVLLHRPRPISIPPRVLM